MNPVSVVGLGAAEMQFVEVGARASLHPLRLLREIREIPQRMAHLLAETDRSLERLLYLGTISQRPSLVDKLSQQQLDSIRSAILEAQTAAEGLQAVLQPVVSELRHSSTSKRAWGALISKKLDLDVEQRLESIGRIHSGLMPQLQALDLEMAIQKTATSKDIKSEVQAAKTEALGGIDVVKAQVAGLEITKSLSLMTQHIEALQVRSDVAHSKFTSMHEATLSELRALYDSVLSPAPARHIILPNEGTALAIPLSDASIRDLGESIVAGLLWGPWLSVIQGERGLN